MPGPAARRGLSGLVGADLPARAGAAIVLMAVALGTAWAGGVWFVLFWLAAAGLILWEWQNLVGAGGAPWRLIPGGASLVVAALLAAEGYALAAIAVLGAGALGGALAQRGDARLRLWTGAGVIYAGALLVSVCLLRLSWPYGFRAVMWLFAVVWGTDIMAYFGGRLIGGPKLWPRVSPGKTWSGFWVGVLCGAAAGLLVAPQAEHYGVVFLFGLAAGAVAQAGDLFESALKRRFGAKDSSHLIPGHGGLMDRLDGFIAAALFAALTGALRFGVVNMAGGIFLW